MKIPLVTALTNAVLPLYTLKPIVFSHTVCLGRRVTIYIILAECPLTYCENALFITSEGKEMFSEWAMLNCITFLM